MFPALGAWGAAALALTADGGTVAAACGAALLAAGLLIVLARRARRGRPETSGAAGASARAGALVAVAAVLLCAVAGAAAAAFAAADTRRGPLPELARRYGQATLEVTVTADPRPARPHVRGSARTSPAVVVEAEAVEVVAPHAVTAVRTPVLLIAPPSWSELLPSTRLRAGGRLAPPSRDGDRFAAVLRVDGHGPPRITAPPSAVQRAAARLRAGLRDASEGLAPRRPRAAAGAGRR
ncbi:hypothetical protein GCM10020000_55120 [Streptomyces olivoverticillatus]